jgi:hypothetical protein
MYCPKCSSEYREGFTECATCSVSLVNELPPKVEPDYIKFVTVYESGDPAFISFTKSVLDSEGINYFFKGEGLQDLFAGGRIGTGFNPLIGPVEIQVDQNDAEYAKQLLQQIEDSEFEDSDDYVDDSDDYVDEKYYESFMEEPHTAKSNMAITSLLKGLLIGALITGAVFFIYNWKQKHISGIVEYDLNKDTKSDVYYSYEKGTIVKTEHDRNFDGQIDDWGFYVNGFIDHSESDNNFDGGIDTLGTYNNGIVTQLDVDTNNDNEPDMIEYYDHGVFTEQEWLNSSRKIVYKRAFYKLGVKHEEFIDEDLDGKFDKKITYNYFEKPVAIKNLN